SVDRIDIGPGTWPTNCAVAPQGGLYVTDGRGGRLLHLDIDLSRVRSTVASVPRHRPVSEQ
ncbi:MAG: hypothetical protein KDB37_20180, partial [Ilumatobacter sp.]|nr:hypothetical protein [Ilumatobacter sp.]